MHGLSDGAEFDVVHDKHLSDLIGASFPGLCIHLVIVPVLLPHGHDIVPPTSNCLKVLDHFSFTNIAVEADRGDPVLIKCF